MRDHPFLSSLGRTLTAIERIERVLTGGLVLFIAGVIVASVLFRYFLSNPLIWAEEACVGAFVWLSFIGASVALKRNRHIRIETFGKYLPRGGRVGLRGLSALVATVLTVFLALLSLDVIPTESQTRTVTLPFAIPKAWLFSVPLLVSSVLMAFTSLYFVLCALAGFETEDQLPGLAWSTTTTAMDNL